MLIPKSPTYKIWRVVVNALEDVHGVGTMLIDDCLTLSDLVADLEEFYLQHRKLTEVNDDNKSNTAD